MLSLTPFLQAGRWRPLLAFATLIIFLFVISTPSHLSQSSLRRRTLHDESLEERGLLEEMSKAAGTLFSGGKSDGGTSIIKELFSGNMSGILSDLASDIAVPAGFLGSGLALGVVAGMRNTSVPTTNATGINLAAQNLGSGLTKSLVGSISIAPDSSDMTVAATNDTMSMMIGAGTINGVALALAQGLGSGASQALNFTAPSQKAAFNTSGVNGAAGNLGLGLSSTFLSGVNTTSLLTKAMSSVNINDLIRGNGTLLGSSLNQIAAGAGTGLGQGASVGLGLQNAATMGTSPNGSAGAVQDFTMGLTSSFLQNGTLSKFMTSMMSSAGGLQAAMGMGVTETDMNSSSSSSSTSVLSNLNIAAVAQGFAVGLLDGAGNTLAGMPSPPMQTLMFNDSVGGAATGFGRGLGAQGTTLVKQVFADPSIITNFTKSSTTKRSILHNRAMIPSSRISVIQGRESTPSPGNSSFINALNATTLDPILQMGINTIGCAGVGGLASIGLGLFETGTIDINQLRGILNMNKNITNNQTFVIENGGNTYTINLAKMDVQVNGIPLMRAVVALVIHIIFAILTYFLLAPTYILIHSTKRITALSSLPSPFPAFKSSLLTTYAPLLLYILSPILILATFILGFVIKGFSSSPLSSLSAHGIIGAILLVPTLLTFGTSSSAMQRKNPILKNIYKWSFGITMILAVLVLFSGFVDLANYSFCAVQALPVVVWIVLGGILLGPLGLAGGAVAMEGLLARQRGKNLNGLAMETGMLKGKGSGGGGEKTGSYFDDDDDDSGKRRAAERKV